MCGPNFDFNHELTEQEHQVIDVFLGETFRALPTASRTSSHFNSQSLFFYFSEVNHIGMIKKMQKE